jgi:nicotinamide-nucleotide amidase
MQTLIPLSEEVGKLLVARNDKVAVAESAAGGLINAALLAVAGASGWCLGGAVLYTRRSRLALKDMYPEMFAEMTGSTEVYARFMARMVRERFDAQWCLCETGTAGPTGSRYGYPAGHACFAVSGPVDRVLTIETGNDDRVANMYAFAEAGLRLLVETLKA